MAKASKKSKTAADATEQVDAAIVAVNATASEQASAPDVGATADEGNAEMGDNSGGWSKRKALGDVFKLGQAEAQGLVSRTEIARTLIRAASELSDVNSGDADKFYQAYTKGKAKNPDAVFEAKEIGRASCRERVSSPV